MNWPLITHVLATEAAGFTVGLCVGIIAGAVAFFFIMIRDGRN